ncbi:MAG TPA: hypothetical protein VIY27_09735 [Myxococcota bacterium]
MAHWRIFSLLCCALCSPVQAAGEAQAAVGGRTVAREDARRLEARGPGSVFASIETAAVDALTYAYLQGQATREAGLVRGGAIFRTDDGYSYAAIHVATPLRPHKIAYGLGPQDVARFVLYPRIGKHDVDRANEQPSRADRRSVHVTDPLHRPLFILHPSLAIRAYRGEGQELSDLASLRRPDRAPQRVAEN